jgi:DNA-binding PadR family transcriptional regulator
MDKKNILLHIIKYADGFVSPVQIQKLMFLLEKRILTDREKIYNFQPYNFGPFDRAIYNDLKSYEKEGLIETKQFNNLRHFELTDKGREYCENNVFELNFEQDRVEKLAKFVKKLSFEELIVTVYDAYPEMKVSSKFIG